jgi:hypothetical protein
MVWGLPIADQKQILHFVLDDNKKSNGKDKCRTFDSFRSLEVTVKWGTALQVMALTG